ncbi:YebC/PmpR family DNA-binding transcriptional regulator, partial [Salmonella enterica subsp. enterica serovar Lubbock]|nr:YebC/PmpR family DNA-binding transcriptional regulator [Salmonella enterica subsp. enterica serovar Lubbock]
MSSFQFEQIGVIRSPYKEKFAVPRQPGLVKSACGELHLIAPYNQADAVRGLDEFSTTELEMIAQSEVELSPEDLEIFEGLVDALEDDDDVQ